MEIAAFELLERVARLAGDEATVVVAQRIRADEEATAAKIAASWDEVALESLRQEGVELTRHGNSEPWDCTTQQRHDDAGDSDRTALAR